MYAALVSTDLGLFDEHDAELVQRVRLDVNVFSLRGSRQLIDERDRAVEALTSVENTGLTQQSQCTLVYGKKVRLVLIQGTFHMTLA